MLRQVIVFQLSLFLLCLAAGAMGQPTQPPTILEFQSRTSALLSALDQDLAKAAQKLSGSGITGEAASVCLSDLYDDFNFLVDVVTIDTAGRLALIEPPKYKYSEGTDISDQEHIIKIRALNQPVLSKSFKTVEGFYAVTLAHPVVHSPEGIVLGYVSAVIKPDTLLRNVINQFAVRGQTFEAFAIQLDGKILYDRDILQVGKMIFSDPAYQAYPSVLSFIAQVTQEASGSGSYNYTTPLSNQTVRKNAEWATVTMYGTVWRLVVAHVQQ